MADIFLATYAGPSTLEKPTWAILVKPTRAPIPFSFGDHRVNLFECRNGTLKRTNAKNDSDIGSPQVKIRIAAPHGRATGDTVDRILRAFPAWNTEGDWIDTALTLLQGAGLVPSFNLEKFRTFATQEIVSRCSGQGETGAAEFDYLTLVESKLRVKKPLSSEVEMETSSATILLGFRLSAPPQPRPVRWKPLPFERQDDPYAGLM